MITAAHYRLFYLQNNKHLVQDKLKFKCSDWKSSCLPQGTRHGGKKKCYIVRRHIFFGVYWSLALVNQRLTYLNVFKSCHSAEPDIVLTASTVYFRSVNSSLTLDSDYLIVVICSCSIWASEPAKGKAASWFRVENALLRMGLDILVYVKWFRSVTCTSSSEKRLTMLASKAAKCGIVKQCLGFFGRNDGLLVPIGRTSASKFWAGFDGLCVSWCI